MEGRTEKYIICVEFVKILVSARFVKEKKKEKQSCFFRLTSNRCIYSDTISPSQCALNQCETATDAPRSAATKTLGPATVKVRGTTE